MSGVPLIGNSIEQDRFVRAMLIIRMILETFDPAEAKELLDHAVASRAAMMHLQPETRTLLRWLTSEIDETTLAGMVSLEWAVTDTGLSAFEVSAALDEAEAAGLVVLDIGRVIWDAPPDITVFTYGSGGLRSQAHMVARAIGGDHA